MQDRQMTLFGVLLGDGNWGVAGVQASVVQHAELDLTVMYLLLKLKVLSHSLDSPQDRSNLVIFVPPALLSVSRETQVLAGEVQVTEVPVQVEALLLEHCWHERAFPSASSADRIQVTARMTLMLQENRCS